MNDPFNGLGLHIPEILLPNPAVDLYKWAVVACDQYTSQPEYWEEVARLVGSNPSTYHLIFPEAFLGKDDEKERINRIQQQMRSYLTEQVLVPQGRGFIYLERQTSRANLRQGLIVTVDLECYDYHPGSQTLIRATEGTVLDRIPPRVRIREEAPLESPHIMVLIDDPECRVIAPLEKLKTQLTKVYETQLMMNGGKVSGYLINQPEILGKLQRELAVLAERSVFEAKYGVGTAAHPSALLLFAVGDGNHSLATAKAVWERLKQKNGSDPAIMNHPARYAMVELVNVHDPGLQFEPIHRVVFQADLEVLIGVMQEHCGAGALRVERSSNPEGVLQQMQAVKERKNDPTQVIGFTTGQESGVIQIENPRHNLEVGSLQIGIDQFLITHPQTTVDYVHGERIVAELGRKPGNIGFYLPVMSKQVLFKTVIEDGVLPRKTFSMGEAEEKRYYLECRKLG